MNKNKAFKAKWRAAPLPFRCLIWLAISLVIITLLLICYINAGYLWAKYFGGLKCVSYIEDGQYTIAVYNNTPFVRLFLDVNRYPGLAITEPVRSFYLTRPFGVVYAYRYPKPPGLQNLYFKEIKWLEYGLFREIFYISPLNTPDEFGRLHNQEVPIGDFGEKPQYIETKVATFDKSLHSDKCYLPWNRIEHFMFGSYHN